MPIPQIPSGPDPAHIVQPPETEAPTPDASWAPHEDARKLHAEINQLSNQRFLLTTFAITVFVTADAALLFRTPSPPHDLPFAAGFSIVLEVFLFLLWHLSNIIRYISRCEATYLVAKNATHWEQPWREFRKRHKHSGFASIQKVTFVSLILLQAAIPAMLKAMLGWTPRIWSLLSPILVAAFLITIIQISDKRNEITEDEALQLWRALLTEREKETVRPPADTKALANTPTGPS